VLFEDEKNIIDFMNEKNYKSFHLLNDCNHVIQEHCFTDQDFYKVYKNFGKECDILKCNYFMRNNRDRDKDMNKQNNQIFIHSNSDTIHIYKFLDEIHSYFFHSIDAGFKFAQNELDGFQI